MVNFLLSISTDTTSWSILHNVKVWYEYIKNKICLTITNKNKSDEK